MPGLSRSLFATLLFPGLLALALSGREPAAPAQEEKEAKGEKGAVKLEVKKYADIGKAIRKLRGKVVVADIWAFWCVPCKKEFPHLVELHRKYAPDGLACVSVSLDDEDGHAKALKFLQDRKATFLNLRAEEDKEEIFKKMDLKNIPAVFVFDRDGLRAGKFTMDDPDNQFSYEKDVEPLVRELLRGKK
jgi:thiol-disulfide isomerase/thioredoxin